MTSPKQIRIVPTDGVMAMGTKVFVGDQEIGGVTAITIHTNADNPVWEVSLTVLAEIDGDINALLVGVNGDTPQNIEQGAKDVTGISDTEKKFSAR